MNSCDRFMKQNYHRNNIFTAQNMKKTITDKDCTRGKVVWKHFNIKNLGEYHDLYLMTDIYLMADGVENCRDMCRPLPTLNA